MRRRLPLFYDIRTWSKMTTFEPETAEVVEKSSSCPLAATLTAGGPILLLTRRAKCFLAPRLLFFPWSSRAVFPRHPGHDPYATSSDDS